MKKIIMIAGAILLAALIAAGGFWGGMAYQSNQASQARNEFFAARGMPEGGVFLGDEQGFPGEGPTGGTGPIFMGGGGITGQVQSIDGDVLTLSTPQDVTTVNLSEETNFEKSETASASDIEPGMQVMVTGERDSDGEITATRILILDNDVASSADPSGTGLEP